MNTDHIRQEKNQTAIRRKQKKTNIIKEYNIIYSLRYLFIFENQSKITDSAQKKTIYEISEQDVPSALRHSWLVHDTVHEAESIPLLRKKLQHSQLRHVAPICGSLLVHSLKQ